MAKRGRRVRALETRPRLTPLAKRALALWAQAKGCRRIGFGGPEGLDPAAVLACVDASGWGGASSRGTLLRLVLTYDRAWLAGVRRRREEQRNG